MQFLKISCSQCARYQECPQVTRMYVNYCGSDIKRVEEKIAEAAFDCRTRRGLLFAQTLISVLPSAETLKPVLAISSV